MANIFLTISNLFRVELKEKYKIKIFQFMASLK